MQAANSGGDGQERETGQNGSEISKFFDGKSIFITGAAGFVGSVLLESLLRCCPGIRNVYILMRAKKGVLPEDRKDQLLNKKIFRPLKNDNPDVLNKIKVVKGDISFTYLGLEEESIKILINEVSIVFHCAAIISFMKPLRFMLVQNLQGTQNVVNLSARMKNLEVFVHTSTAYANCNKRNTLIKESVERLAVSGLEFLDALNNNVPDDVLADMQNQCLPMWPNNYAFTKALVEDYLADIPVPLAIVRPSIIFSSWKGIMPGYTEEGAGLIDVSIGIGKGFIRVLYCDGEKNIDIIPVDVVTNTLISAAWSVATNKMDSPLVISCTSGGTSPCSWKHFITSLYEMNQTYPLPKMYQKPSLVLRKHRSTYWASALANHYAPAICIDAILLLLRKQPRLTKLYRFYDLALHYLGYFLTNEWQFQCDNFLSLPKLQSPEDAKLFPLDMKDFSIDSVVKNIKSGSPFYEWENDRRNMKDRLPIAHKRALLTNFIKWTAIMWLAIFFFFVLTKTVTRVRILA